MKSCKECGLKKYLQDFYNHSKSKDGFMAICKDCHKSKVKNNRQNKLEYYRAYDAKRFQNDSRVVERHKRYQKTKAGINSMTKSRDKWKNNNPKARQAHIDLGNAVKYGKIVKPFSCSKCLKEVRSRNLHAHHEDYDKPYEVVWLCVKCHSDEHKYVAVEK